MNSNYALTFPRKVRQSQRSGSGKYERTRPWQRNDTVLPVLGSFSVMEAEHPAAMFIDYMYKRIDGLVTNEGNHVNEREDRQPKIAVGSVILQLGPQRMAANVCRVYYACKLWRVGLHVVGAPLKANGQQAEITLTAVQFRQLMATDLMMLPPPFKPTWPIPDTDIPWMVYMERPPEGGLT